ncbi:phage tail protein [Halosquirtibacter laminarini]|uniref:Phage tail protein n=1 Tax=Halosquirtibacter laminarini TaxID=3374600 RepID=A0AC61NFI7_9BACT|nr:phage tail protein [Prolixibacteraceae bacterium]
MERQPVAFYFKVVVSGTKSDEDCSFQEVSGIRSEIDVEEVHEGGENGFVHALPKGMTHSNLILKRCITAKDGGLAAWCSATFKNDGLKITTKSVDVHLMDENKNPLRSWNFTNVYPVKWEVDSFNSTKNELAIEVIELRYNTCERTK